MPSFQTFTVFPFRTHNCFPVPNSQQANYTAGTRNKELLHLRPSKLSSLGVPEPLRLHCCRRFRPQCNPGIILFEPKFGLNCPSYFSVQSAHCGAGGVWEPNESGIACAALHRHVIISISFSAAFCFEPQVGSGRLNEAVNCISTDRGLDQMSEADSEAHSTLMEDMAFRL